MIDKNYHLTKEESPSAIKKTNDDYSKAVSEVLDILKHTNRKDVDKIPELFMKFLRKNKSKTFVPQIDYSKELKENKLQPKTEALLGLIYYNYWATEEEKKEFKIKLIKGGV